MKNKILTGLASLMLMFSISTLKAEVNVGASVMLGQLDTSGTETENGTGTDKHSKSLWACLCLSTFFSSSLPPYLHFVRINVTLH